MEFLVEKLVPLAEPGSADTSDADLSPEAEAAMAAFALVYDSEAAWEEKASTSRTQPRLKQATPFTGKCIE